MTLKVIRMLEESFGLDSAKVTKITEIFQNVFEVCYGDEIYVVMNKDGADQIVDEYRRASIRDAEEHIPLQFQRYFNFGQYAEDTWQSVYDIYDDVDEVEFGNEDFYICSL